MTSQTFAGRALAAAALLAFCLPPPSPAAAGAAVPLPPALAQALQRAQQWRGARFLDWLPGGQMLLEAHTGHGILLERLDAPGARAQVLTTLGGGVRRALAARSGVRLLYARRAAGATQWLIREGTGAEHPLAGGAAVLGTPVWSAGGERVAFLGRAPGGAREAVYIAAAAAGEAPRLVAGALKGRWRLFDWARDGRTLLLAREDGPDQQSLYTLRTRDGALTGVPLPPARIRSARFAPGGAAVELISNQGSDFERLLRVGLHSGRVRVISAALPWDVSRFAASADGRYLAYTLDVDGESRLHVWDGQSKLDVAVPWLQDGVIDDLRFDAGHRLAFTFQSSRQPPEIDVYDAAGGLVQRWCRGTPGAAAAAARLVHYPTWDRIDGHWRMVSAYIYLPGGPAPAPVLIVLHAHPAGQFRPRWRPFLQFVANDLGYAVIAPNVRGSSGYGRSFRELADGARRLDAVRDIGSLMVWIGMQPGFDARRIVLMGRGYGGWLAVNALATFDGHLLGAIDIDGIASLDDYIERAPAERRAFRRAEFADPRDPGVERFLRRISPLGEVERIRSPLLIVQGLAGDPVRAADAQQLAYLLRFHGVSTELLTVGTAGRRFGRPQDRRVLEEAAARFLLTLKARRAK
ncbi:MAG: S9 family peptidase [Steroidobacteraceae bacterium]